MVRKNRIGTQGTAILLSVKSQRGVSVEEKIRSHQDLIAEEGAVYWGIGFPIVEKRFRFPLKAYVCMVGKGEVHYSATIDGVEVYTEPQRPKHEELCPWYYAKFPPYRTYFIVSELKEMSKPMKVTGFKRYPSGEPAKGCPQGYTVVNDPFF